MTEQKAIPAGNSKLGWTADFELLTDIAKEVRNKNGTEICLEGLDDVIASLARRGFVVLNPPNDKLSHGE